MRFLKNKLIKTQEAQDAQDTHEREEELMNSVKLEEPDETTTQVKLEYTSDTSSSSKSVQTTLKSEQGYSSDSHLIAKSRHTRPTKNISINYGKAISSFAVSDLAVPYLEHISLQEGVTHKEFVEFIYTFKETIGGIESLKALLQIYEDDNCRTRVYKKLFKRASEVFIKYFSVNWIIHGKVKNKLVYLQYRGKMLRRVQNPDAFTYIQKRTRKDSKCCCKKEELD